MKKKLLSFILAICMLIPCSLALTACGSNPPDEPHTHSWATTWSKSSTHHWYDCDGCDDTKDKATHSLVDGVCSVCEYDTNHTHEYGTTYLKDSDGHWQKCQHCDENTTKANHTYSGNTCSVCDYEKPATELPIEQNVRDLEIITIMTEGSGTSTLVKLPDGKNMLIDSGADNLTANLTIDNLFLLNGQITTIDYFVLTNTTESRVGYDDIFDFCNINNLYKPTVSNNITPSNVYELTLTNASSNNNCTIYTIEENNLDIDYTFKDNQGNTHNYKIDFMIPIAPENCTESFDNSVVITIEYQGKVVMISSDTTEENIDGYCAKYGNQKNVDVLISSYNAGNNLAIATSGTRGTDYLNKIGLTATDYCIILPTGGNAGIIDLYNAISYIEEGYVYTLSSDSDLITDSCITITTSGTLTVTAENKTAY